MGLFWKTFTFTGVGQILDLGVMNIPLGARLLNSFNAQLDCEFSFNDGTTWIHQRSWTSQTETTEVGIKNGGMRVRFKCVAFTSGQIDLNVFQI